MTLFDATDTYVILNKSFNISVPHISTKERKIVVFLYLEISPYRGYCIYGKISLVALFARHPVPTYCTSIIILEERALSKTAPKWVHQVLLLFSKGHLRNVLEAMNCCAVNVSTPLTQPLKENMCQGFCHLLSQWGWD